MSTFNGRRAPNVSQYLANLNTVPSSHDVPADISIGDADLDFLTNAEFFDFDSFHPHVDVNGHSPRVAKGQHGAVNGHQYQFGEFQTYPNAGLHGHYPPQPAHALPFGSPQTGDKRKASVSVSTTMASPQDLEDQSRMAAEEDKRRRNTAASARFRVKKKQREQALEKQAKEMADKVSQLEGKVQQLEMENKWLKGLITDKGDGKVLETMPKETDGRKADEKTDGVGTTEEAADVDVDDEDEDEE